MHGILDKGERRAGQDLQYRPQREWTERALGFRERQIEEFGSLRSGSK